MTDTITVFVNGVAVAVPPGATAGMALAEAAPELAQDPMCRLTDARGLPLAPDAPLAAGSILRAARSARRADASDA